MSSSGSVGGGGSGDDWDDFLRDVAADKEELALRIVLQRSRVDTGGSFGSAPSHVSGSLVRTHIVVQVQHVRTGIIEDRG